MAMSQQKERRKEGKKERPDRSCPPHGSLHEPSPRCTLAGGQGGAAGDIQKRLFTCSQSVGSPAKWHKLIRVSHIPVPFICKQGIPWQRSSGTSIFQSQASLKQSLTPGWGCGSFLLPGPSHNSCGEQERCPTGWKATFAPVSRQGQPHSLPRLQMACHASSGQALPGLPAATAFPEHRAGISQGEVGVPAFPQVSCPRQGLPVWQPGEGSAVTTLRLSPHPEVGCPKPQPGLWGSPGAPAFWESLQTMPRWGEEAYQAPPTGAALISTAAFLDECNKLRCGCLAPHSSSISALHGGRDSPAGPQPASTRDPACHCQGNSGDRRSPVVQLPPPTTRTQGQWLQPGQAPSRGPAGLEAPFGIP